MNHLPFSIVGNLTEEPELRFTPAGDAVCKVTIAHNPKKQVDGKWKDGEATFMPVTVWRGLAENVAESLHKGDRVIAVGIVSTERWKDKEGVTHTRMAMTASALGPDLTFHVVTVKKMVRRSEQDDSQTPPDDTVRERPAARSGARAK